MNDTRDVELNAIGVLKRREIEVLTQNDDELRFGASAAATPRCTNHSACATGSGSFVPALCCANGSVQHEHQL